MDTLLQNGYPATATRSRDPTAARRRILDSAAAEFAAVGFAGARVDRIAQRADVNKRMLYHYFGDKQELYGAVLVARLERLSSVEGADLNQQLTHLAGQLDETLARLLIWRLLESEAETASSLDELRSAGLLSALESLQNEGSLPRNLDLAALVSLFVAHLVLTRARGSAGSEDASLTLLTGLLRSMAPSGVAAQPKPRIRLKPATSDGSAA